MTLSLADEVFGMKQRWPDFRSVAAGNFLVVFHGALSPLGRTYQIRIIYGPKMYAGVCTMLNHEPRVEVISPKIVLQHPKTGEMVPHIYRNENDPSSPLLCLYYPRYNDWQAGKTPIADTIVPWALQWLACYEGWLATGEWTGGGKHPSVDAPESLFTHEVRPCATPSRQSITAVERQTGSAASRAILAFAVSVLGPDLKKVTPSAERREAA